MWYVSDAWPAATVFANLIPTQTKTKLFQENAEQLLKERTQVVRI